MPESIPFDLHVLSIPPAFILSQDQTLHCNEKVDCSISRFRFVSSRLTTPYLLDEGFLLYWLLNYSFVVVRMPSGSRRFRSAPLHRLINIALDN
jgi:hypothetical protein